MVAGGHMTDVPPIIRYTRVMYRETMRISLTMATLNNMSVNTSDIMNACIKAPCGENLYTILGLQFGPD